MQLDRFWQLVELAKAKAGSDTEARVDGLRAVLGGLDPAELQSFQNH